MQDYMIIKTASYLSWSDLLSFSESNKPQRKLLAQLDIENLLWQPHVESCFPGAKKSIDMQYKTFFIKQYQLCKRDVSAHSVYLQSMPNELKNNKYLAVAVINSIISRRMAFTSDNLILVVLNLLNLENIRHVFSHPNSRLLATISKFKPDSLGAFLTYSKEEHFPLIMRYITNSFNLIIRRYGMDSIFHCLNEARRQKVFDAMKHNLNFYIKDSNNLGSALKCLNEPQRQVVLDEIKGNLSTIIKSGGCLRRALEYLNETQCDIVFSAVKNNLSDMIKDSKNLGAALEYLNETQRDIVFNAVKNNLSDMIKDGFSLSDALRYLNETQCKIVLNALKNNLSDMIKDGSELSRALGYLSEAQCVMVFNAVKNNLSDMIKGGYDLGVLLYLNETQRDIVFDAIKGNLCTFAYGLEALSNAVRYLNDTQFKVVFDTFKGKLYYIRYGEDLNRVLRGANETKSKIVVDAVKDTLCVILKNEYNFDEALRGLNEITCEIILDAFKDKISDIIKDSVKVRRMLFLLNDAKVGRLYSELHSDKTFVLTAMQFDISYIQLASGPLKGDISLILSIFVPFMAYALLHPEVSKSILLGLATAVVVISAAMTGGLSLLPSAAIAVSAGTFTGGASFFALKSSNNKLGEIAAENENQNTLAF